MKAFAALLSGSLLTLEKQDKRKEVGVVLRPIVACYRQLLPSTGTNVIMIGSPGRSRSSW